MSDAYIPNTRDATIAWFGRNPAGNWRQHCCRCNDDTPLTEAARVYGDLYVAEPAPEGHVAPSDVCDVCGVTLLALSQSCQAEHDAQQARWARGPVTGLVEYGITAFPRCRIY